MANIDLTKNSVDTNLDRYASIINNYYRKLCGANLDNERQIDVPFIDNIHLSINILKPLCSHILSNGPKDLLFHYAVLKYFEYYYRKCFNENPVESPFFKAYIRVSDGVGQYDEVCQQIENVFKNYPVKTISKNNAYLLQMEARARRSIGEFDRSIECLQEVLAICQELGDQILESRVTVALGKVFGKYLGHTSRYYILIQAAINILKSLGKRVLDNNEQLIVQRDLAIAYDCLGTLHNELKPVTQKEQKQCLFYLEEAYKINSKINNLAGKSRNIAHRVMLLVDTDISKNLKFFLDEMYRAWIMVCDNPKDWRGAALRQAQYGYILGFEDNEDGLTYIRQGLKYVTRLRSFRNMIKIRSYLAETLYRSGNTEESCFILDEALCIANDHNFSIYSISTARRLAFWSNLRDNTEESVQYRNIHYLSINALRQRFEQYINVGENLIPLKLTNSSIQFTDAELLDLKSRSIVDYRNLTEELATAVEQLLEVIKKKILFDLDAKDTNQLKNYSNFRQNFINMWFKSVDHDLYHIELAAIVLRDRLFELSYNDVRLKELSSNIYSGVKELRDWLDEEDAIIRQKITLKKIIEYAIKRANYSNEQIVFPYEEKEKLNMFEVSGHLMLVHWAFWSLIDNACEAQRRKDIPGPDRRLFIWAERINENEKQKIIICIANNGEIPKEPDGFIRRWIEKRSVDNYHLTSGRGRGRGLLIANEILSSSLDASIDSKSDIINGHKVFCVNVLIPEINLTFSPINQNK